MSLLDNIHKVDLLAVLETFRECKTGPKYKDPMGYSSLCYNMMTTCDAIYAPGGVVANMSQKDREAWNIMFNDMEDWMIQTWKTWPKFSGSPYFPVPAAGAAFGSTDHQTAFYEAGNSGTMWNGPYGDNRKELAGFLFERLAAYLMTRP
jgi:hypothetical protein